MPHRYNQTVKLLCLPVAVALFSLGCGHDINNKEAVRKGVVEYLSKRTGQTGLDMNNMAVDITSVTFQKDEAHAVVSFKPKGSTDTTGMSMNYVLEKNANQWVVKGRQESGVNPHGGGAPPPTMPMPGMGDAPSGAMPPNHPPVTGAKPESK